jgi:RimJ/RimL family protein N-acetyltransferase
MLNPYLVGDTVYLRPYDPPADAAHFVTWFNDPEVTCFLRRYLPLTAAEQDQFFRSIQGNSQCVALAIVRRSDDQLLGGTGLRDIDPRNRHAWFGITIGDRSAWGKGFGTEATGLMLRLAFQTLNLNRVFLHVYEFNERGRHVYEKLGFQVEGRLRQDVYRAGRYWDTIVMGILRDEWLALGRAE